MGSDVGQIFPKASLHRDHSILYALVCEKDLSHMDKNNGNPDLVCEKNLLLYNIISSAVTYLCIIEGKHFLNDPHSNTTATMSQVVILHSSVESQHFTGS